MAIAAAAVSALAAAGGGSASSRTAPDLGTPPHVEVGQAATFAAPAVRPGTPLCPSATLGQIVCYSPSFLRQAYDFPDGPGAPTGAGQTILVVEAYGSPTIADDVAAVRRRLRDPRAAVAHRPRRGRDRRRRLR